MTAERFSKQLLDIGEGKIEEDASSQCILLPSDFCKLMATRDELIKNVFLNIEQNYTDHQWLSERAILAAKNIDVNEINFKIQNMISSESVRFKSIDTVVDENDAVNYPTEFLNSLDIPGLPPHLLLLKIGLYVILI